MSLAFPLENRLLSTHSHAAANHTSSRYYSTSWSDEESSISIPMDCNNSFDDLSTSSEVSEDDNELKDKSVIDSNCGIINSDDPISLQELLSQAEDESLCGAFCQIYTDWANHYLEKANYTRFITDLQKDVSDGLLLADVICAVANKKVPDLNTKPKSATHMLENVTQCLEILKILGVNTDTYKAEDIRDGNLKAILGLFFSLSRYKQQSKCQASDSDRASSCSSGAPPAAAPVSTPSARSNTASSSLKKPEKTGIPSRFGSKGPKKLASKLPEANGTSRTQSRTSSRSTSPSSSVSSGIPVPTKPLSASARSRQLGSAGSLTSSSAASSNCKTPRKIPQPTTTTSNNRESMLDKFKFFRSDKSGPKADKSKNKEGSAGTSQGRAQSVQPGLPENAAVKASKHSSRNQQTRSLSRDHAQGQPQPANQMPVYPPQPVPGKAANSNGCVQQGYNHSQQQAVMTHNAHFQSASATASPVADRQSLRSGKPQKSHSSSKSNKTIPAQQQQPSAALPPHPQSSLSPTSTSKHKPPVLERPRGIPLPTHPPYNTPTHTATAAVSSPVSASRDGKPPLNTTGESLKYSSIPFPQNDAAVKLASVPYPRGMSAPPTDQSVPQAPPSLPQQKSSVGTQSSKHDRPPTAGKESKSHRKSSKSSAGTCTTDDIVVSDRPIVEVPRTTREGSAPPQLSRDQMDQMQLSVKLRERLEKVAQERKAADGASDRYAEILSKMDKRQDPSKPLAQQLHQSLPTEATATSPVKPMQPLLNRTGSNPYAYLKLLTSASKAYTQVASQSTRLNTNRMLFDPKMAANRKAAAQPQVPGPDYHSDAEGYMSDGDMLKNRGYMSDSNSGYMSEGGIGVYARRMQRCFREGMQAVQESLTNPDSDSFDEDSNSVSSGEISDAVAELAADESLKTPGGKKVTPVTVNTSTATTFAQSIQSMPYGRTFLSKPQANTATTTSETVPHLHQDYNSLRRYASDVEPDYISDGSLDRRSLDRDCYFSDTEPMNQNRMVNYGMGANSDTENSRSISGKYLQNSAYGRRGFNPQGNSALGTRNMLARSSMGARPYDNQRRMPGDGGYPTQAHPPQGIRMAAGQAPAAPPSDLGHDLQTGSLPHSRSLSVPANRSSANIPSNYANVMPGGKPPLASPLRETNPISPATSLSNIKLPYSTVKSSNSSTSLQPNAEESDPRGSSLSLYSNHSNASLLSANEEKQSREIFKLKKELEQAQIKVTTLTTQLCTNASVVSAFEQSLTNMTARLQNLSCTAEQKDSELAYLRNTIEDLRRQSGLLSSQIPANIDAAAAKSSATIQSSESVSSLTNTSTVDRKAAALKQKKNPQGWLRASLGKALHKKKPGQKSSLSDYEDSPCLSTPGSPVMSPPGSTVHTAASVVHSDTEDVHHLRKQLEEKDHKLTDMQLDALNSAHQLEQLQEIMTKMRNEMSALKADNNRLQKVFQSPNHRASVGPRASPEQSLSKRLSLDSGAVGHYTGFDLLSGYPCTDESRKVTVSVCVGELRPNFSNYDSLAEVLIGCIPISFRTKWDQLDTCVRRLLKEYVIKVDPMSNLGLNGESIVSYFMGDCMRSLDNQAPEHKPSSYLSGEECHIKLILRSTQMGGWVDSLAFETLIPKAILQRYVSLLVEYRRIILCGPSGTGKSYLAQKLAEYIVSRERRTDTGAIATFNVDHKSAKELRSYLSSIAEQAESGQGEKPLPLVIILDNLHHVKPLSEVFNSFLSTKQSKSPFIIGTMNQATCSSTNLQLHHNFRWVLCANHMEPIKGFLGRYLRRKAINSEVEHRVHNPDLARIVDWIPNVWQHINKFLELHSSSDVTIGPRQFLSLPMSIEGSQVWFTDLWNYSIIPYLLDAVREGLQSYGRRAPWEDPSEWIAETWPWTSNCPGHDVTTLIKLRPEDVGYDNHPSVQASSNPSSNQGSKNRNGDISGTDDPLLTMLMRLQEAASYSAAPSTESDSSSHETPQHQHAEPTV